MKKENIIYSFILIIFFWGCSTAAEDSYIIDKSDYLTGRFNPAAQSNFVNLADLKIPTDGRTHYLRKEAAVNLKLMIDKMKSDISGIHIYVRSSTRSFFDQKEIWEAKWKSLNGRSARDRADEILKFSSMPGTSRHHWGTDFDINELHNAYYESGKGKEIYEWLLKNAWSFGFCQPYTFGRNSGYQEEKWHWSYMPLSSKFLKDWNFSINLGLFFKKNFFLGSELAEKLAPIYVNSINRSCVSAL